MTASTGRRLGAYQLLEQIGGGGMGEVHRAVRADDEYQDQVAIKLVRAGQDSPFVIDRLRTERQILASLKHPNIARLLDGGTSGEGVPFLVMELIDGQPITVYCREHRLDIGARLRLFQSVCAAVQYAHERMVIHRDIKPSNILVNRDGTPKLLDFGVAKILEASDVPVWSDATIAARRILTPEYASPEQLRGAPVTAASDVYSLGAVLYELLTGVRLHAPGERLMGQALELTRNEEPERPSTIVRQLEQGSLGAELGEPSERIARSLRGDLDNIVLMALRKEPERRYSTVAQLADDIDRHLKRLPIRARRPTLGYRAGSFVARHALAVAACAGIVTALIGATILTTREARIAEAQRARAERRFNDLRELANSLMFEIHDSIQDLPGSTAARKLLVTRALKYLDSLSRESGNDPTLQRELADAYKRIGDVQGYAWGPNLGDTAGALRSYEKNLTIRQALASSAGEPAGVIKLAEAYRLVGGVLQNSNDSAGALRDFERAVEVAERAERADGGDVELLQELARDYEAVADVYSGDFNGANFGSSSAALPLRRKVIDIDRRLAALRPGEPRFARGVAVSITKMGDELMLEGRWTEAAPYYDQARRELERLAAAHPNDALQLQTLDELYTRLDMVDKAAGRPEQAAAVDRLALAISSSLRDRDPHDAKSRMALAGDEANLADALAASGHTQEARRFMTDALATMAPLLTPSPANSEFSGVAAALHVTSGDVYRSAGDPAQALREYRSAKAILEPVRVHDPNNVDARLRVAAVDNEIAAALERLGDLETAAATYEQALLLARPETRAADPNEQALYSTADSYAGLATTELASARRAPQDRDTHQLRACSWYRQSTSMRTRIREPSLQSPDGFWSVQPALLAQQLTSCTYAQPAVAPRPNSETQ